ncbi:MAG: hypothetical protein ACPK7O_02175 [Methanobacterium sp.]
MDILNINCYCVDPGMETGKPNPAYYWTNATEETFKEILDNYLAENGGKFNDGTFTLHVVKNGYYIHTRRTHVFFPKQ